MAIERTFDRLVEFDQRSREFPIRAIVGEQPLRSYIWACGAWLDQGREGACVGFSWSHELAARPVEVPVSNEYAQQLYHRARQLDEYLGEDYDGTSVIAGAKAVVEAGLVDGYRWGFSVEDLALAVGYHGPAVLGVPWYSDMLDTDTDGWVRPSGDQVGGHAIMCRGVDVKARFFTLRNSWGRAWGIDGDCLVRWDDMAELLANDGEICIPVGRHLG